MKAFGYLITVIFFLSFLFSCTRQLIISNDNTQDDEISQGTTYYVAATGGNNGSNGLTPATAWETLSYATSQVITHGDTIYMLAGIHTISSGCFLPVGVNLAGAGNTSIINNTIATDWNYGLHLISDTVDTNGNQQIANLRFTGNSVTAYGAIYIAARGNVFIHDCEFEDFDDVAVTFDGQANGDTGLPAVWSKGNRFYNNIVTNCCKRQIGDWMSGALQIGAQEGMQIYNNHFTENERGGAQCGYPIKYYANGYNRDLKIYGNNIVKLPAVVDSYDWNFAIELWNWMGGIEIYNNHIEGSIDIDHVVTGDYSYGTMIHDNYFGYSSLPTSSGNWANLNAGLYIEFACADVYIYKNEFHNLESAIRFSPRNENINGIYIYYNVINQIGNSSGDNGCNLLNFSGSGFTINNLNFLNNTVYAGSNGAQYGIILPAEVFTNTHIRNNIFHGFEINPIEIDGNNKNHLYIENNIFFGSGTNAVNITGTPADYISQNNQAEDPLFINPGSNFSLQGLSPAINGGMNVGLYVDYTGHAVPHDSIVDIGAYEYIL